MASDRLPSPDAITSQPTGPTSEDRQWAMFAHLSGILLGWVGPLIIWLVYKDRSPFIDSHGKEALNFQLNVLVYMLISIPLICVFGIGLATLIAAGIYAVVMSILAGLKANEGQMYTYPATSRVIP